MVIETLVIIIFWTLLVVTVFSIVRGAPYVPTGPKTVSIILDAVRNPKGKKVVDLGSGDGRLVIAFAEKGAYAVGYEINPFLVLWSRFKIARCGLSENAKIFWGSYWNIDLKNYNIINVFGISYIMKSLEAKLKKELKRKTLVVSYAFKFPGLNLVKEERGVYIYKI